MRQSPGEEVGQGERADGATDSVKEHTASPRGTLRVGAIPALTDSTSTRTLTLLANDSILCISITTPYSH